MATVPAPTSTAPTREGAAARAVRRPAARADLLHPHERIAASSRRHERDGGDEDDGARAASAGERRVPAQQSSEIPIADASHVVLPKKTCRWRRQRSADRPQRGAARRPQRRGAGRHSRRWRMRLTFTPGSTAPAPPRRCRLRRASAPLAPRGRRLAAPTRALGEPRRAIAPYKRARRRRRASGSRRWTAMRLREDDERQFRGARAAYERRRRGGGRRVRRQKRFCSSKALSAHARAQGSGRSERRLARGDLGVWPPRAALRRRARAAAGVGRRARYGSLALRAHCARAALLLAEFREKREAGAARQAAIEPRWRERRPRAARNGLLRRRGTR